MQCSDHNIHSSKMLFSDCYLQSVGVRNREALVRRRVPSHNSCISYDLSEQSCEVSLCDVVCKLHLLLFLLISVSIIV